MADDKVPELQSESASQNERLQRVPDADIDKAGVFKYILIKVHDKDNDDDYKYIVRGTVRGEYHADIYEMYVDQIEKNGLDCEVVGGGRIRHEPKLKKIHIYGYSQGYGLANHAITKAILDKHWEKYTITWANEGY